ncbi:MAG: disulfide bond formation protein B [Bordetella sp.]|nr:MAG: disulfide bond formation protein B [Bordetella sp.]
MINIVKLIVLKRQDQILLLIAFLCFFSLAVVLISQHVFNVQPCAWCITHRLIFSTIFIISFLSILFNKHSLYNLFISPISILILSISGFIGSWKQYNVDNLLSCNATFGDWLINFFKFDIMIPWLFQIQSSCSDSSFTLIGINYPIWNFGVYIILLLLVCTKLILILKF